MRKTISKTPTTIRKKPVVKKPAYKMPQLVNDVDPQPFSKTPTTIRKNPMVNQPVYSYNPQMTPTQLLKNMKKKQAMKNRVVR